MAEVDDDAWTTGWTGGGVHTLPLDTRRMAEGDDFDGADCFVGVMTGPRPGGREAFFGVVGGVVDACGRATAGARFATRLALASGRLPPAAVFGGDEPGFAVLGILHEEPDTVLGVAVAVGGMSGLRGLLPSLGGVPRGVGVAPPLDTRATGI